jgi:hypothetical protein
MKVGMRGIGLKRPRTRPHTGYSTARVEPIRTAALSSQPAGEAPDLIEPLTAFRCWRTDGLRLRSPYLPVYWDERVLAARCHSQPAAGAPHTPPHGPCGCGIHAYQEPNLVFPTVDYRGVTGIVTLHGKVEVGPRGMRAELARVEALGFYARWSGRQRDAVAEIAERLEVDLIDLGDLAEAATDYGLPLSPESLVSARAADYAPAADRAGERLILNSDR